MKRKVFSIRLHGTISFRDVYWMDLTGLKAEDAYDSRTQYEKINGHWFIKDQSNKPADLDVTPTSFSRAHGESGARQAQKRPFSVDYGLNPAEPCPEDVHKTFEDQAGFGYQMQVNSKGLLGHRLIYFPKKVISLSPSEVNRYRKDRSRKVM